MSEIPDSIGPYRIVGTLGEGGMGTVYRAKQAAPLEREVALKLLKLGMDTDEVVARFERERRALALMEHPCIAAVYDAGTTEAGRPYFVMELVRGERILEYCDSRRLPLRQRVGLFTAVCRAVQHAHQKGVIHRDLKPSNILVTDSDGDPQPKIIDFGIAVATEEPADSDGRLTRTDGLLGTPAYMSPERIGFDGLDVDTRSDIYSLGVILYELVAGVRPFKDEAYQGWAAVAASLAREAPPPSARLGTSAVDGKSIAERRGTDESKLRQELKGELDWIVLRCVEKDRDRRYDTAADLATELDRFLADEPVLARPPSRGYRARKFVKRNPAASTLAVALVLALTGFGVVQSILRAQVSEARDEAVMARDDVEEVLDFMVGDLYGQLEPIGQLPILRSVGQAAMEYFAGRPLNEFSDDELAARSRALYQLGSVNRQQGDPEGAQRAFQESLRLARGLSERHPDSGEFLFGLGQSEYYVADIARRLGDLGTARAHFEAYRDVSVALVAIDSTNLDWVAERGYSHNNLGTVLQDQGHMDEAREEFLASLAVRERLVALDPTPRRRYDLARAYTALSSLLDEADDLSGGVEFAMADASLRDSLAVVVPDNRSWARQQALAQYRLGRVLRDVGDLEAAEGWFQRSVALNANLSASDPTNMVWARGEAISRLRLASIYVTTSRVPDGLREIREAESLLDRVLQASPNDAISRLNRNALEFWRAVAALEQGDFDRAEDACSTVLGVIPDDTDKRDLQALRGGCAYYRAQARRGLDDAEGSESDVALALSIFRSRNVEEWHREHRHYLARVLALGGRTEEAAAVVSSLWALGYRHPAFVSFAVELGLDGGR